MKTLDFIATDQYGHAYHMWDTKYPRKWLLDYFQRQSAQKMYVDTDRGTVHIGYVIAGHWISVYRVSPWKTSA